jgi:hypothetical protein
MSATPDANPLSPSMKFIALVANSNHAAVIGTPTQPMGTAPM